ncbi:hypothetical protein BDW72DRAFT_169134 [Aspergillus terricola var. indicus]
MTSRSMSILTMPPSDVENECWNECSETRRQVLCRLRAILQERLSRYKVPPPFWAFCQVADISKLERLITLTESTQDTEIVELILESIIKDCDAVIDRWLQKISCKKRDNKCILTGLAEPDAAHIYPHCLLKASTREPRAVGRFWDIMKVFWEKSRVQRWKAEIFGNEQNLQAPQDGCFNMLSLDKSAHALWGAGRFALRPMETSDRTLKVQFHWQKRSSNGVTELDLLTEPESSRGLYGDTTYSLPVLTGTFTNNGEPLYKAIASGDILTIATHDPEHLPLPSWSLLEMQWYLQRIAGMSGAAEVGDDLEYIDYDADSYGSLHCCYTPY